MKTTTENAHQENGQASSKPVSKRKVRNFLLFPEMQVKYSALYAGLIVVLAFVTAYLQTIHNNQLALQIADPAALEGIVELQRQNLLIQMGAFGLAALMFFLMTILITHRFVGPIIPIIRFLQTEAKTRPLTLRTHDELKPLIDYLNSVDIKVSRKDD